MHMFFIPRYLLVSGDCNFYAHFMYVYWNLNIEKGIHYVKSVKPVSKQFMDVWSGVNIHIYASEY